MRTNSECSLISQVLESNILAKDTYLPTSYYRSLAYLAVDQGTRLQKQDERARSGTQECLSGSDRRAVHQDLRETIMGRERGSTEGEQGHLHEIHTGFLRLGWGVWTSC